MRSSRFRMPSVSNTLRIEVSQISLTAQMLN